MQQEMWVWRALAFAIFALLEWAQIGRTCAFDILQIFWVYWLPVFGGTIH
jgi:hypothetical protein